MILIELWWCCLNPRERNCVVLCLSFFTFAGAYITQASFNAFWLVYGKLPDNAMVTTFVWEYGLIAGTAPDAEGDPVDVYYFDLDKWSQIYAFSLTDGFICLKPCKQLTFPD